MALKAIIREAGNGIGCAVGDHVVCDGQLYRVESLSSDIHTDRSGQSRGGYLHGTVVTADWSDVPEDFEPCYRLELPRA